MTSAEDRAERIRARLAAAVYGDETLYGEALTQHIRACGELDRNAPADLAFLLAERDELLRRVEQAERAGAVKALREAGNREQMPHDVRAFDTARDRMEIAGYLDDRADAIKNGAPL